MTNGYKVVDFKGIVNLDTSNESEQQYDVAQYPQLKGIYSGIEGSTKPLMYTGFTIDNVEQFPCFPLVKKADTVFIASLYLGGADNEIVITISETVISIAKVA